MLWVIISIVVVIIDQLTKRIVVENISMGERIPVIENFFYLTLHKNSGAAWGILQDGRLFFLIIIPIVSAIVIYSMIKNVNRLLRFSCALILGGAVGNYIDRLLEGKVTDFLLFYIGSYPFPIFNVADMAVTCGTILLAVFMLFVYKEPPKKEMLTDDNTQVTKADKTSVKNQGEEKNAE